MRAYKEKEIRDMVYDLAKAVSQAYSVACFAEQHVSCNVLVQEALQCCMCVRLRCQSFLD